MGKFNIRESIKKNNENDVVEEMTNGGFDGYDVIKKIPYQNLIMKDFKVYELDEEEVRETALSIATIGLEQNLVVKETDDPNIFVVVTGHKRLTAIHYIFDNRIEVSEKVSKLIRNPNCIVVPKDEDDLITKIRMHETNVTQRKQFKVEEMEAYLKDVAVAKERGLLINGRKVVGSARSILQKQYGFSDSFAKKYLKLIKSDNAKLKQQVNDGEISINQAYLILQGKLVPESDEKGTNEPKEPKDKEKSKEYDIIDFRSS